MWPHFPKSTNSSHLKKCRNYGNSGVLQALALEGFLFTSLVSINHCTLEHGLVENFICSASLQ